MKTALDLDKPISPSEQKEFSRDQRAKWFAHTLETLIALAKYDSRYAKHLCNKVADTFGPDDILGPFLAKCLRVDRMKKPRGRKRKWDYARYYELLMLYRLACDDVGRKAALDELATKEKYTGANKEKKIEKRISEARKAIPNFAFPFECPPDKNNSEG